MLENNISHIDPNSPCKPIRCACGCGIYFTPSRKDKKYLDSKHQNHHYNNTKRSQPNIKVNSINKILINNDRILEDFYNRFNDGEKAIVEFKLLQKEGFDSTRFVGDDRSNGYTIFYSYNYVFFFDKEKANTITIYKI